MNVAIGGEDSIVKNSKGAFVSSKADGTFGHMYMNFENEGLIYFGIEEAAPQKTNALTAEKHGFGVATPNSAFGAPRLEDFQKDKAVNAKMSQCPMITKTEDDKNSKYNCFRARITPDVLDKLREKKVRAMSDQIFIEEVLKKPPPNSISVDNPMQRYKDMIQHRQQLPKATVDIKPKPTNHQLLSKRKKMSSGSYPMMRELLSQHKRQKSEPTSGKENTGKITPNNRSKLSSKQRSSTSFPSMRENLRAQRRLSRELEQTTSNRTSVSPDTGEQTSLEPDEPTSSSGPKKF